MFVGCVTALGIFRGTKSAEDIFLHGMKLLKRLALMIFCCLAANLMAQDASLSVEVSSDTVLVGNYFELKYTIENADMSGFESPDLHKLNVIGGPNSSTSISIINGNMSQKSSAAYYLKPEEVGSYTIPPAFLNTGESILESPPIEIIVMPNPEGIIQQPGQASRRYDEVISSPAPKDTAKTKRGRKI